MFSENKHNPEYLVVVKSLSTECAVFSSLLLIVFFDPIEKLFWVMTLIDVDVRKILKYELFLLFNHGIHILNLIDEKYLSLYKTIYVKCI